MKSNAQARLPCRGVTLVEMSLVIGLLVVLISVGFYAGGNFSEWKKGRAASEILRTAYTAQRTFLADNPTAPMSSITHALLLPYLPGGPAAFPTGTALNDATLNIYVGASPPFFTTTATTSGATPPLRYDPSGSHTDSLWDVGE